MYITNCTCTRAPPSVIHKIALLHVLPEKAAGLLARIRRTTSAASGSNLVDPDLRLEDVGFGIQLLLLSIYPLVSGLDAEHICVHISSS